MNSRFFAADFYDYNPDEIADKPEQDKMQNTNQRVHKVKKQR